MRAGIMAFGGDRRSNRTSRGVAASIQTIQNSSRLGSALGRPASHFKLFWKCSYEHLIPQQLFPKETTIAKSIFRRDIRMF